jgi:hypothetical protein
MSMAQPDRGSTTSTPRWVKVLGIIAVLLLLLLGILMLIGGEHGPARHIPSGGVGMRTSSTGGVHTASP